MRGEGVSGQGRKQVGRKLTRAITGDAERESGNANPKISHAAQQNIYEEEKKKVWDEQWRALSNPVAPELTPQDEVEEPVAQTPVAFGSRFSRGESFRARSRGGSLAMTPALESPGRDMSPAFSADGESTFTGNHAGAGKVMRIKRVVSQRKGRPWYSREGC
jgi:transcription initiation factor TFIID subunit 1